MVLEETHTHVSVEDFSELVLETHCTLLHLDKALLLSQVTIRHATGSRPSSRRLLHHRLVTVIVI